MRVRMRGGFTCDDTGFRSVLGVATDIYEQATVRGQEQAGVFSRDLAPHAAVLDGMGASFCMSTVV
jgi:hypothetical protein